MSCQNSRNAFADEVSRVAESFPAALKDTRKGFIPVGIAKGDNSHDPVLDCTRKAVSRDVGDLSSLTLRRCEKV